MNNSTHILFPAPFAEQLVNSKDLERVFISLTSHELGVASDAFEKALYSSYFCEGDVSEHVDRKLGLTLGSYRAAVQRQLALARIWSAR